MLDACHNCPGEEGSASCPHPVLGCHSSTTYPVINGPDLVGAAQLAVLLAVLCAQLVCNLQQGTSLESEHIDTLGSPAPCRPALAAALCLPCLGPLVRRPAAPTQIGGTKTSLGVALDSPDQTHHPAHSGTALLTIFSSVTSDCSRGAAQISVETASARPESSSLGEGRTMR